MKLSYQHITFLAFLSLFNVALANEIFNLDTLLNKMLQQTKVTATFIEKKNIKGITQPIESSGELIYIAPSTIIKRTNKPKLEILKIEGNSITFERGGNIHSFETQDYLDIASYFEGIRHLLSGNRKGLEENYNIELSGVFEKWIMALSPKVSSSAIAEIRLLGKKVNVYRVEVFLVDGDSSTMEVSQN